MSITQAEQGTIQQVREAAQAISARLGGRKPLIGLILGSGLGDLAGQVTEGVSIDYSEVPHFPVSTVEGHAGRFVIGELEGRTVIVMQGRFHYYEGYSMKKVVFPVYVMRELGVRSLVITNAAGGMNRDFKAGDLMLISDHINLTGDSPLIGANEPELGVRFPDMSRAYSRDYRSLAKALAAGVKGEDGAPLTLQEGVYCGISGPAYMTPAELTMLARVGGDAVGMSTVGEVIAASHAGLKVLGISCITDMAIGEELEPLTHEQVMEVATRTKPKFQALVKAFVAAVAL
ncbi:MAG: punA2 [Paenibacillaceae bacterium]|jgi:purine-nucleoside phosphorylase|nr:punA2 [Paenibacillaceae bacterium]